MTKNFKRTEEQTVTGPIAVWALPKTRYQIEAEAEEKHNNDIRMVSPFRFELHTGHVWDSGAVKLYETTVDVLLPGDIDLLAQAVETLREAKREEQRKFDERMEQLEKQIRALALLEYQP